jgi:hypothetical protein
VLTDEQKRVVGELKKRESEKKDELTQIRRTMRARIEALEHLHGITNSPSATD